MSLIESDGASNRGQIQVLTRAMEILRLLNANSGDLSQVEIGMKLGMARSTVSRLLIALEAEGLVRSTGSRGRYRLGPELVSLAASARQNEWRALHPLLLALSEEINETVDLSILDGNHAVFVDQVVANHRLQAVAAVGDSFPLHATANGKALLAAMPVAEARRIISGELKAFTKKTITDPEKLSEELVAIRKINGIAFDREEHTEGICAVGAVVGTFDHELLAVSIPVPFRRFERQEERLIVAVEEFRNKVREFTSQQ